MEIIETCKDRTRSSVDKTFLGFDLLLFWKVTSYVRFDSHKWPREACLLGNSTILQDWSNTSELNKEHGSLQRHTILRRNDDRKKKNQKYTKRSKREKATWAQRRLLATVWPYRRGNVGQTVKVFHQQRGDWHDESKVGNRRGRIRGN